MSLTRNYYGNRVEITSEDGKRWHEATPAELAGIAPDKLVRFNRGEARPAGEFGMLRLPGNYAFLPGIAALLPVYVEDD